jgi:hypothetical protein
MFVWEYIYISACVDNALWDARTRTDVHAKELRLRVSRHT